MADTIEERLSKKSRHLKADWGRDAYPLTCGLMEEAAGELTRLRAEIARLKAEKREVFERTREQAHDIALAIDSGRGNEKAIAAAIRAMKEQPND